MLEKYSMKFLDMKTTIMIFLKILNQLRNFLKEIKKIFGMKLLNYIKSILIQKIIFQMMNWKKYRRI